MTNLVQFPGLGLSFELSRVAFSIGGMDIYWYGVCIAFGLCLALVFAFRRCTEFGIDADSMVDVILIGVVLGIASARLYYVAMAPYNYDTIWDVLAVRDGGLAIYGGIIAGVLTAVAVCKIKEIRIPAFLDLGCFGLLIGQLMGRWGNFFNREAFGSETTAFLRMGLTTAKGTIYVHPTFLYESLWNLAGLLILHFWTKKGKRKFDGQVFLLYVLWYGVGRFFIEGLRSDSLYLGGTGIRVSQLLAAVSAAAALILLIMLGRKPHTLWKDRELSSPDDTDTTEHI